MDNNFDILTVVANLWYGTDTDSSPTAYFLIMLLLNHSNYIHKYGTYILHYFKTSLTLPLKCYLKMLPGLTKPVLLPQNTHIHFMVRTYI